MYRLATLVAAFAVATTTVAAAAQAHSNRTAGPWYTPKELKALIAYSNASFANKQRILGGERPIALAVPTLTPKERAALDVFANASFAEKQRILAGKPPKSPSHGFQWRSAAAGGTFIAALVLVGAAVLVRRRTALARRPDPQLD